MMGSLRVGCTWPVPLEGPCRQAPTDVERMNKAPLPTRASRGEGEVARAALIVSPDEPVIGRAVPGPVPNLCQISRVGNPALFPGFQARFEHPSASRVRRSVD